MLDKPVPYYEQFYNKIKQMIFDGEYQPGERINETQLAKKYSVSKSPVREAIRLLEKEGLVILNEKSKVVVYEPSLKDVEEVYFCRMALESFATGLTTRTASDEELNHIEKTLDKTEQAIADNLDPDSIIALNEKFHALIMEYTKNNRLQKQVNDLNGLIHYFRILNFEGENRAEIILNQHRSIFKFIKERKDKEAADAITDHLQLDIEHLYDVLQTEKKD